LIKNAKYLFISIFLLIFSMALNFPFPHEYPLGQETASAFNIPISTANDLHYIGVAALLLLGLSMYFLVKSLEKFQARLVLLALLLAVFLPYGIVSGYQKTLASGIYAVSYDRNHSSCSFEMVNENTLIGSCNLPFENNSDQNVYFSVEFYEKYLFEDERLMVSLMNEPGPYEVVLKGKERRTVQIEAEIDISEMKNHVTSGEALMVNIIMKSGRKTRKL
jgi:hypothetical protein